MTVIDQIRNEIGDKAGTLIWSANLVAALGEPKDWEYTGLCVEGDPSKTRCACGHPIAECYIIEHKVSGRQSMLGSTCIGYFEQVGDIYEGDASTADRAVASSRPGLTGHGSTRSPPSPT